jgi:ATP phosphoribosyltransferase regulatory subunit
MSFAERIVSVFENAGYRRVDAAILQPADIFLDLSGEEIRHRLYVTSDAEGREWALRPEFTIPAALSYLASPDAGYAANYSYLGPVFRVRQGEADEFLQAGLESFGRHDREAADAEIIARAVEALASAGETRIDIRLGDMGLFNALLQALDLHPVWQRRLRRLFAKGALNKDSLETLAQSVTEATNHAGLLKAVEGQDPKATRAFVEDILQIAGISTVGGRSAGEIAERFLAQASNITEGALPDEALSALAHYAEIDGNPDDAADALRRLMHETGLDLGNAVDAFETRAGFVAARGIPLETVTFSARFGRNLDYYTGAVFEIRKAGDANSRPLVGGGRYDRLTEALGGAAVPAVGCAVFIDRMTGDAS